jgi:DinB family protein
MTRPDRTEAADYYFTYIDRVAGDDICGILERQSAEVPSLLRGISDDRSLHRYAPEKWSIREVVGHLNDTERLFVSRAFWFARGFDSPWRASMRKSQLPLQALRIDRGAATWTSSVRFARRQSRSSGAFRPTPGCGAA